MKLKVLLPTHILIHREVSKVTAEGENGAFCLLPHHIDFVSILVPGILSYEHDGQEEFLAVDMGTLVKCGPEVIVSTMNAIQGKNLGELRDTVEKKFLMLNEKRKVANSAIAKLEVNFIRQFIDLEKQRYG